MMEKDEDRKQVEKKLYREFKISETDTTLSDWWTGREKLKKKLAADGDERVVQHPRWPELDKKLEEEEAVTGHDGGPDAAGIAEGCQRHPFHEARECRMEQQEPASGRLWRKRIANYLHLQLCKRTCVT